MFRHSYNEATELLSKAHQGRKIDMYARSGTFPMMISHFCVKRRGLCDHTFDSLLQVDRAETVFSNRKASYLSGYVSLEYLLGEIVVLFNTVIDRHAKALRLAESVACIRLCISIAYP
jgi:hypothetical protein